MSSGWNGFTFPNAGRCAGCGSAAVSPDSRLGPGTGVAARAPGTLPAPESAPRGSSSSCRQSRSAADCGRAEPLSRSSSVQPVLKGRREARPGEGETVRGGNQASTVDRAGVCSPSQHQAAKQVAVPVRGGRVTVPADSVITRYSEKSSRGGRGIVGEHGGAGGLGCVRRGGEPQGAASFRAAAPVWWVAQPCVPIAWQQQEGSGGQGQCS